MRGFRVLLVFLFLLSVPSAIGAAGGAGLKIFKAKSEFGADISGDRQVATKGGRVTLRIQVENDRGEPVRGVPVHFRIVATPLYSRGASLADEVAKSDVYGRVRNTLILGDKEGEYIVSAFIEGVEEEPLVFTVMAERENFGLLVTIGFLGGLSLFLYGIRMASRSLQRVAGNKMRDILASLTKNRFIGFCVGILVTSFTQSSGATSSLLIGFVSAGLMSLKQTLGVILGAGIGGTITVQLLAFQITDYLPLLLIVGSLMFLTSKNRRYSDIGQIILGFGLVFYSIGIMSGSMSHLKFYPAVGRVLASFGDRPILGVIVATAISAAVQSSTATMGIAIALGLGGLLTLPAAITIMIGANVGTGVTAILSGFGSPSREAKQVAIAHILFKVVGAMLLLPFIPPFARLVEATSGDISRQIANAHTMYNAFVALVFLPLIPLVANLICGIVPAKKTFDTEYRAKYLDEQVLDTPPLAISQATREILRMAGLVESMLQDVMVALFENNEEVLESLKGRDNAVDTLNREITLYLAKIFNEERGANGGPRKDIGLLYIVYEIENVGDIIDKNILELAQKKINGQLSFSKEGQNELMNLYRMVEENLKLAIAAFATWDQEIAQKVKRHQPRIQQLEKELHRTHIIRLHRGLSESVDTSAIHLDVVYNLKRINTRAANIADVILGKG
ncbi:MAG: Na/Pi symporter [bacterium]